MEREMEVSMMSRQTVGTIEPAASPDSAIRQPVASRVVCAAKTLIFSIYLYCGYVQVRDFVLALLGRSRAVVLYYHRVGGRDVLTKPADEFRADLEYLKSKYECISFSELCERLQSRRKARRRSVVITFDDGYRDNFSEAVPVLKEVGVTATFFVATGFIGTDREFPHDARNDANPAFEKLTWGDLRAMEAAGFEVGSHTVNHTNLGATDALTVEHEVTDSLAALNRELGRKPRSFSFPWGKPSDISNQAIEAIKRAGYYAAASAYGGANSPRADLFNIRRIDVGNGHMGGLAFKARVAGLDPDYFRLKLKNRKV